jgi:acetyl esterase/lipase
MKKLFCILLSIVMVLSISVENISGLVGSSTQASAASSTTQTSQVNIPLTNINYVDGSSNSAQTLDIQLPTTGQGPYPVVVFIHGGAWVIGEKETNEARVGLNAALSAGYAVVCINYRLAQNAQWPAQIYDCKAAVRYVRAHAGTYNLTRIE